MFQFDFKPHMLRFYNKTEEGSVTGSGPGGSLTLEEMKQEMPCIAEAVEIIQGICDRHPNCLEVEAILLVLEEESRKMLRAFRVALDIRIEKIADDADRLNALMKNVDLGPPLDESD